MSGAVLIAATNGGLSITIAPLAVFGFGVGTVTTTQSIVSTVSGGVAPFSYLWTSYEPTIYPVQYNQPFSFFRRDDVQGAESYSATVRVTVVDAAGQTAYAEGSVTITGT